jgi:hypothetical protein
MVRCAPSLPSSIVSKFSLGCEMVHGILGSMIGFGEECLIQSILCAVEGGGGDQDV